MRRKNGMNKVILAAATPGVYKKVHDQVADCAKSL